MLIRQLAFCLPTLCIAGLSCFAFTANDLPPTGETNCTPFTVQGRVVDVFADDVDTGFVYIAVEQSNATTYVSYKHPQNEDAVQQAQHLIGCEVSVNVGLIHVTSKSCRQPLKTLSRIHSLSAFTIVSPAKSGPFDVPSLVEDPPALQDVGRCGARKLTGVVIARWNNDSFLVLISTGDAIKVRVRGQRLPELGQTVEVVGKVATDLYRFNLMQAQWRLANPIGLSIETTPRAVELSILYNVGDRSVINSYEHGRLIRIRGRLQSVLVNETGHRRLLLAENEFKIVVDCSAIDETLTIPKEGSLLEVSGICVFDSENWQPGMGFPKVNGLFVVPRTAADIVVLKRPPWWTPARFAVVVVSLLAVLVCILIWNASLRVLVTRKSRALLKEQSEKLSESLKVGERTRLAAELHDFHSQNLTAIAYQISSARNTCESDPSGTKAQLETAARMLKSCRTDLRRCLWDLRNDALNEPDFATAIRETVTPVAGSTKVSVRFTGHRSQISDSTAHALLSILRELTSNAVIHGQATDIRIAGEQRSQIIRFSVQDNGCGFDTTTRPGQNEGHFGLDGIQERMNRIGGTLDISSTPAHGTYIRLAINHSPPQS